MSKKYEQLIEYIINDEEDKAKELFHDIVVETSRDIYENLIDEEDFAEEESVEDMSDAIEADEEGISEEDDEIDMEMPDMGDEEGEEEGEEAEEEELEDRVMDLEDALDELKAEFDSMMDDDGEEKPEMDMDMEMEMEATETDEEAVSEEAEEEVEESEESEVVKEYVDKVAQPANNSEAHTSPVANKNDMGGKAVDPTGEEKGGSTPKVAPGKAYKNTAGGKAPMEKAPAPKTGE